MNALSLHIITTETEFQALDEEWTALHEEAKGTIFQSFRWLADWWSIYRRPDLRLRIATVRDSGVLVGVLPAFIEETHLGPLALRRLRLLGTLEIYGEYAPFLRPGRETDVLACFARFCADELKSRSSDVITLFRFDSASRSMGLLLREVGHAKVHLRHDAKAIARVMMPLPADWETYLKSLTPAERGILRRRSRSLEKSGAKLETIMEPSQADFDDYVRLHTAAWTGKGIAGYFSSSRFEAFHRRATSNFMRNNQARLYFFAKDGVRFAAVHAYFMHGQCCFYLSGLDRMHELVRYSPGKVLLSYVIRDAIREGCTTFDFQGGTEQYKYKLGGKETGFAKTVIWEKGIAHIKVVPLLAMVTLYNMLVGGIWAYQVLPRLRTFSAHLGLLAAGHGAVASPQERTR